MSKKKPAALAAADISCPGCGSTNSVRVAGVYESPRTPANWYCRCYSCERGYNPRLKEDGGGEVAHGDKMRRAREKLPREEFEKLFKQGLSDQGIADVAGVVYHHVVRLKKEYGFTGIVGHGNRNPYQKKETDTMSICENINPVQENEAEGCSETVVDAQEQQPAKAEGNDLAENVTGTKDNGNDLAESEGKIQVEQTSDQAERKMTIAAVLELREELNKELHCTTCLLNDPSFHKEDWAPRIKALLEQHHRECEDMQKHINQAFETVEISI